MNNLGDSPGLKSTPFKLSISKDSFKKEIIEKKNNIIYNILNFFGCIPIYETKILDKPIGLGSNYIYRIKILNKKIRIFGIIVKTIKYE